LLSELKKVGENEIYDTGFKKATEEKSAVGVDVQQPSSVPNCNCELIVGAIVKNI